MHIRILSPASPTAPETIDAAARVLQQWGHIVSLSTHAKGNRGMFSGTPAERISDLNDAFADPQVDAILCSRGGYGLAQIIDKIIIPQGCRKLVIGFSDITCLHSRLGTEGIPSLHAIMCKHIASLSEQDKAWTELRDILAGWGSSPLQRLPIPPTAPHTVSGILHGGNLAVLMGLSGTPYGLEHLVAKEPTILFIEDVGERHHAIDRMMQNLRLSGVLSQIKGLIVGQFADCNDDTRFGCTLMDSIRAVVAEYDYPVLWNYPAGHVSDNRPLLMNAPCSLTEQDGKITLTQTF